jgi:hypothetical protein
MSEIPLPCPETPHRDFSKGYMEDHDYIRAKIKAGWDWEDYVIRRLAEDYRIYDVKCRARSFRKSVADIATYTVHSGDLLIRGRLFEIKSRNVKFTAPSDWPTWWPLYVDTWDGYRAKLPKPWCYIHVSQDTGAFMATMTERDKSWIPKPGVDREEGRAMFICAHPRDVLDEAGLVARICNP